MPSQWQSRKPLGLLELPALLLGRRSAQFAQGRYGWREASKRAMLENGKIQKEPNSRNRDIVLGRLKANSQQDLTATLHETMPNPFPCFRKNPAERLKVREAMVHDFIARFGAAHVLQNCYLTYRRIFAVLANIRMCLLRSLQVMRRFCRTRG